jgi:hypothetical protein
MPAKGCILAYWSSRKESIEACAERLARTLQDLEQISPIFPAWSDVKHGAKFVEIKRDVESLTQLLSAGRNREDFPPRRVIEDLGFRVSVRTNDKAWEYVLFQVHCGGYCKDVPNRCITEFPEVGPHSYETVVPALKVKALRALIMDWNPDRGAICSRPFYRSVEAEIPPISFGDLGWITYVPHRRGELPEEVRQKFHVEEVPSFGNLIYLTKEPPQDETNPDFLKMAIDLYQTLERHGIYRKTPIIS